MKKKIVAIFLVVALVLSVTAVFAACQSNKYTITFRRETGKILFELETKNGKITKEAVENAANGKLPNREEEGYFFDNWYSTVTADEDGNYVFENPIDYDKVYTTRADYYAGYEMRVGDSRGYTIIGVFGDYSCWEPGEEPAEWMLTQDESEGWIYRITVDVKSGNQIKVKTKTSEWDDTKTNLGWGGVSEVKLADGVTLPGDYTISDVIYGTGTGPMDNALVGVGVITANVTIELNARANKFSITINSVEMHDEIPDVNYIIVGGFEDNSWDPKTQNEKYIFTEDGEGIYSISMAFTMGQEWKVTKNDGTWGWQLDATNVGDVSGVESIEVPSDIFVDAGGNDHNIKANYECETTITIDINSRRISILVKSVHVLEEGESVWESEGYAVAGNFSDANWQLPALSDKYVFTREGNTDHGYLTIDLTKDQQFKVATNKAGWSGMINIGWKVDAPIVVKDKDGNIVSDLFELIGNDNIGVRADCNVTIHLDVKTQTIDIVVNTVGEIPEVNNDADPRSWGLIGGMNGWSSDVITLTNQDNGHKTGSYHFTGAFEFKLRTAGAWNTDVGWHGEKVSIVAGYGVTIPDGIIREDDGKTGNMYVTQACTVEFDFYFVNSANWTLVITVVSLG